MQRPDLIDAPRPPRRRARFWRARRGESGGGRVAVPGLPYRRPRGGPEVLLPRQLDLYPCPAGEGGPGAELRVLVALPGQGSADSSCNKWGKDGQRPFLDATRV